MAPTASATANEGPKAAWDAPWHPQRSALTQQQWNDPESYPAATPEPGRLWVVDRARELPPLAFGVLPTEGQAGRLTVREFRLNASLPTAPAELPVYLGGRYPDRHREVFDRTVRTGMFVPQYSSVFYPQSAPLGEPAPVGGAEAAGERAARVLTDLGLLMPDAMLSTAVTQPNGEWSVIFYRRVGGDGPVVYSESNLTVKLNRAGQATYILTHRRPLLSASRYPLRSPGEAWRLLMEGRGRTLYVDLDPRRVSQGETGARFTVTRVGLAYVEAEPFLPRQIVQPYYIFHDSAGNALYVPAVADPWLEWWP